MTIPFLIGILVMTAAAILFAFSLARAAAQGDRRARAARVDYLLRYTGGGAPCVKCGEPTHYSLRGKPIHPTCREDVA